MSACAWSWALGLKTPFPRSFFPYPGPTTANTHPTCSPHPHRLKFCSTQQYRARLLGIGIGVQNPLPLLVLSIPGSHHFQHPITLIQHVPCIPTTCSFAT